MTVQTKTIGRMPTHHGDYDPSVAYGNKYRVTLYGCEWESKHDNNNTAPAVWDGGDTITPNTTDWKLISGSFDTWLESIDKPASTGSTGDYPYNGMGRVKLAKNIVNGVNTLTQDMFYKGAVGSRVPNTNTIFVIQYDFTLGEDITVPDNCVLEFDGGSVSGEYDFVFNNTLLSGTPKISMECTCSGSVKNKELHVEWFGAVGDGTYDSTQGNIGTDNKRAFWNISRIINDSNGGTVIFEREKVYTSSVERYLKTAELGIDWGISVFDFRWTGNVIVELNGSTVQLATNINNYYNVFNFLCCEDCCIKNGNIIGDGRNHSYVEYHPDNHPEDTSGSYEWCYGINGSGSRLTIENVNISHCCGDAVIAGGFNGFGYYDNKEGAIIVRGCNLSYCGRQGISLHSTLWTIVENNIIHHIGTYGTNPGFAPMSGIDIEYEDGLHTIGDVVIRNCAIHDTTSENIVSGFDGGSSSKVRSLLIDNCKFEKGVDLVCIEATDGKRVINNCSFKGAGIRLRADEITNCKIGLNSVKLLIKGDFYNTVFYHAQEHLTGDSGIDFDGVVCKFYSCEFKGITYKDGFRFGFISDLYGSPIKAEFYDCYINADIFTYNYGAGSYTKMYNCVCEDMSIQFIPDLYAKSSRFIDCAGRNIGASDTDIHFRFDDCSFINENTPYDGIDWGCTLPFVYGEFDFCKITMKEPIFNSNWQTIGMQDRGVYRRCIIDYQSETAYYGTIKNFTDCTVSGIS